MSAASWHDRVGAGIPLSACWRGGEVSDHLRQIGPQIEIWLDGVKIDRRVFAYDVEAGTVARYVEGPGGAIKLVEGADGLGPAMETLRGEVEVRWKAGHGPAFVEAR